MDTFKYIPITRKDLQDLFEQQVDVPTKDKYAEYFYIWLQGYYTAQKHCDLLLKGTLRLPQQTNHER